jgi:predicted DNA-binding transcriptional regulator AlpA
MCRDPDWRGGHRHRLFVTTRPDGWTSSRSRRTSSPNPTVGSTTARGLPDRPTSRRRRLRDIGDEVRPFIRVNLLVVRVDSQTELVVAADIAKRLALSRARISVLVTSPGFPRPIGTLGRSQVWRWSAVERWARQTSRLHPAE